MEIIASYEVAWFEGRCRFDLAPDSVQAAGTYFLQARFEASVPLETLQPRVDRLWKRSQGFWQGLRMTTLDYVGYVILVVGFHLGPNRVRGRHCWRHRHVGAPARPGDGSQGAICPVRHRRRGPSVMVAESRQDKQRFEEFIGLVLRQIRASKSIGKAPV